MKHKIIFFITIVFTFFLTAVQAQTGLKQVRKGKFYGIQNQKGKWLIEPKYNFISVASDSLVVAEKEGLFGLLDITGRQRMPFEYTKLEMIGQSGRLKAKKKDSQFGLFDTEGRAFTALEFFDFRADTALPLLIFAQYLPYGKWTVMNLEGKHLSAKPLEGYFNVTKLGFLGKQGSLMAIFSPDGNKITNFQYPYLVFFQEKDSTRKREIEHGLNQETYFVASFRKTDDRVILIDNFGKEYWPEWPEDSAPTPDGVFDFPEKPAVFPGGNAALQQFIKDNMIYSEAAKKESDISNATISFVVDREGGISTIRILRDPGFGCGKAAYEMVLKMPAWIPAEHQASLVYSTVTLNIVCKPEK